MQLNRMCAILAVFILFFVFLPLRVFAASTFTRAIVKEVVSEEEFTVEGRTVYTQKLSVVRIDTGEPVEVSVGSKFLPLESNQRIPVNRTIIIEQQTLEDGKTEWVVTDYAYRLPTLLWIFVLFSVLVLVITQLQGFLSMIGMISSFVVLMAFIIPTIISGADPIWISIVSAVVIGAGSIYLSHGFHKKSHIAYISIIGTLILVTILTAVSMHFAHMTGLGSEEALFLQIEPQAKINMKGLLLAGIVLGTLGILDDICISQVSVVSELLKAKPGMSAYDVFFRGLTVGKDHIASLVNTLVLAYAGASLPLFLLFSIHNTRPIWVILNDEMIAEEIVRTVTGSIGLVLAVPLTTALAAFFLTKRASRY